MSLPFIFFFRFDSKCKTFWFLTRAEWFFQWGDNVFSDRPHEKFRSTLSWPVFGESGFENKMKYCERFSLDSRCSVWRTDRQSRSFFQLVKEVKRVWWLFVTWKIYTHSSRELQNILRQKKIFNSLVFVFSIVFQSWHIS